LAITVDCTNCGHSYTVKDDAAGRKFRCKDCGHVIDVPGLPLTASEDPADPHGFAAPRENEGPPHEVAEPDRQRRRERTEHEDAPSGLGKASLIMGCVVWVLAVLAVIVLMGMGFSVAQQIERGGGQPAPEDMAATVGVFAIGSCGLGCLSYVLSLVGGILGIMALYQPSTSRGQAIAGVVLNGLFFSGTSGLFLLSLILGQR
jgi:predicted Zn finger-like uncharacterized protein